MSDFVALKALTLTYGDAVAVPALDLGIEKGELICLLGPSGCGKTTTMRAIAGLMQPRSGRIEIDGRDVTRVSPARREVGLVFQSYALFPHLTVYENVAFGLRLKRADRLDGRVRDGLATVGLTEFASRMPAELSGGQQQRVALARSMVMEPKVLLLDEPLSNLDARLRLEMRIELARVQRETGVTMVFVTHDQAEALSLADRIVVMRGGRIEQQGTPEDIWNRPETDFVATFMGYETMLPQDDGTALAWRPSAVTVGQGPHRGRVLSVGFAGDRREYVLDSALGRVKAEVPAEDDRHAPGAEVAFDLPEARGVRVRRAE